MLPQRLSLCLVALAGCSTATSGEPQSEPEPSDPWEAGGFAVGHATIELEDSARDRPLTIEVWYPARDATPGDSAASFETQPDDQSVIQALLDQAPADCPSQVMGAQRDAAAFERDPAPLIAFSHCLGCGRYSSFSLAERLASHGMVVVAPDHAGPLPFADGELDEPLNLDQLELRAADVVFTIDAAADGSLFESNDALAPIEIDAERIGMFGHSFGSVTAGLVTQQDARIRAVAGLAAPMENPLLPAVVMQNIEVPVLFVLAEEDNSIGEIGNFLLRENYDNANTPVWRVDIADAGHWSVSDLAGLVEPFLAGCGSGERHSMGREGEAFDYIAPDDGIEWTSRYLATFFAAHLIESDVAVERLEDLPPLDGVTVLSR